MRAVVAAGLMACLIGAGCKAAKEAARRELARQQERADAASVEPTGPTGPIVPTRPTAPTEPTGPTEPGAPPAAPGLRPGRYLVRAVGVSARPRKALGLPWDVGSPPDLRITIVIDGQPAGSCDGPGDQLIASCAPGLELDLAVGTRLELRVVDRDLRNDDEVGGALAQDLLGAGRVDARIALATTGQLATAWIELTPAPSPYVRYRDRLVALAIGGLAGLGLVLGLRRRLVRIIELPIGPDDEWPCRFCAATNRGPVLVCHKCGGAR